MNVELQPAENMALTVALAQLDRGESPSPNVAATCVYALARITRPCPTCSWPRRETSGLVCQTCGWDYANGEKPL